MKGGGPEFKRDLVLIKTIAKSRRSLLYGYDAAEMGPIPLEDGHIARQRSPAPGPVNAHVRAPFLGKECHPHVLRQ